MQRVRSYSSSSPLCPKNIVRIQRIVSGNQACFRSKILNTQTFPTLFYKLYIPTFLSSSYPLYKMTLLPPPFKVLWSRPFGHLSACLFSISAAFLRYRILLYALSSSYCLPVLRRYLVFKCSAGVFSYQLTARSHTLQLVSSCF